VDGMTVHELSRLASGKQRGVNGFIEGGAYRPQPVRGVQIPKPGGGQRQLGIPVVWMRLVQQMILQALILSSTPPFSNSSYGFRPGRGAHMALEQARNTYPGEGASLLWISTSRNFSTG